VFVDSSFWVAISDNKDQWHPRARELVGKVADPARVVDLAASEAITIVGSRRGGKPARELYEVFQDSCSIVYAVEDLFDLAMSRHLRHDGALSVPDCVTVEAMVRTKDRTIMSFDSDFDRVKGIERVH
jgi:predicted nucleic acid-binding protein